MNLEGLEKPFKMGKCKCGGDYMSTNYLGYNVPNAKCNKCGTETVLSPETNLHIKETNQINKKGSWMKNGRKLYIYKIFYWRNLSLLDINDIVFFNNNIDKIRNERYVIENG